MLNVIKSELPALYPFIYSCYFDPSFLRFGDFTLLSDEGPQQGDPLGPLLYCSTAMSLVKRVQADFNCWYMDDGSLGGNVEVLLEDLQMIIVEGKKLGLIVNTAKCEVITDDHQVAERFRFLAPDIKHVRKSAAMLLGAPIGDEQSIDAVLAAKLEDLQRFSKRLQLLTAHDALFLLKNCFAIPKLTYTLRSAPCYSRQVLSEYDNALRSTLQSVLNTAMSDDVWDQATLPVANGGLGIRKATDVELPAFLSSVAGSQPLIQELLPRHFENSAGVNDPKFINAVKEWESQTGSAPAQPPYSTVQKVWDKTVVEVKEKKVLSAASDQAGKARLIAAAAPHSGAFLHARPCSSLGTRLDDSSLRIAIALRLGAPVCSPHTCVCSPHTCVCGATVDSTGRHGLSCHKSAGRHS